MSLVGVHVICEALGLAVDEAPEMAIAKTKPMIVSQGDVPQRRSYRLPSRAKRTVGNAIRKKISQTNPMAASFETGVVAIFSARAFYADM